MVATKKPVESPVPPFQGVVYANVNVCDTPHRHWRIYKPLLVKIVYQWRQSLDWVDISQKFRLLDIAPNF